jgi:hypothetical protein
MGYLELLVPYLPHYIYYRRLFGPISQCSHSFIYCRRRRRKNLIRFKGAIQPKSPGDRITTVDRGTRIKPPASLPHPPKHRRPTKPAPSTICHYGTSWQRSRPLPVPVASNPEAEIAIATVSRSYDVQLPSLSPATGRTAHARVSGGAFDCEEPVENRRIDDAAWQPGAADNVTSGGSSPYYFKLDPAVAATHDLNRFERQRLRNCCQCEKGMTIKTRHVTASNK